MNRERFDIRMGVDWGNGVFEVMERDFVIVRLGMRKLCWSR